jgi:hypothetical protein
MQGAITVTGEDGAGSGGSTDRTPDPEEYDY